MGKRRQRRVYKVGKEGSCPICNSKKYRRIESTGLYYCRSCKAKWSDCGKERKNQRRFCVVKPPSTPVIVVRRTSVTVAFGKAKIVDLNREAR